MPPGKGLGLGTLAHELTHVYQERTVENFTEKYEAETKRLIDSGLSPTEAYTNTFISILTSAMLARDEAPGWPSPFA